MIQSLQQLIRSRGLKNLRDVNVTKKLLANLNDMGIPCMLHKGNQYTYSIYQNQQLRENIDIDLVVEKKNANTTLLYLISQGFSPIGFGKNCSPQLLETKLRKIIAAKYTYQLSLKGEKCMLDVQWGLKSNYHSFDFPMDSIFSNAIQGDFYGSKIFQPDPYSLFWLLVIHHGGKEQWMRIRHLVDFMAFINTHGSLMNWASILENAVGFGLERVLLDGFWYLDKVFGFDIPIEIKIRLDDHKNNVYKQVFGVWENCRWGTPRFEWTSQYIRYWSQDQPKPSMRYVTSYFNYQLEKKQLANFPQPYGFWQIVKDLVKLNSKEK
jgi:hypothetical protein